MRLTVRNHLILKWSWGCNKAAHFLANYVLERRTSFNRNCVPAEFGGIAYHIIDEYIESMARLPEAIELSIAEHCNNWISFSGIMIKFQLVDGKLFHRGVGQWMLTLRYFSCAEAGINISQRADAEYKQLFKNHKVFVLYGWSGSVYLAITRFPLSTSSLMCTLTL